MNLSQNKVDLVLSRTKANTLKHNICKTSELKSKIYSVYQYFKK